MIISESLDILIKYSCYHHILGAFYQSKEKKTGNETQNHVDRRFRASICCIDTSGFLCPYRLLLDPSIHDGLRREGLVTAQTQWTLSPHDFLSVWSEFGAQSVDRMRDHRRGDPSGSRQVLMCLRPTRSAARQQALIYCT
jgi:hypothetical protein